MEEAYVQSEMFAREEEPEAADHTSQTHEGSQHRRRISYDFSRVDFSNPQVRASLHRAVRVLIDIHQRKRAKGEEGTPPQEHRRIMDETTIQETRRVFTEAQKEKLV